MDQHEAIAGHGATVRALLAGGDEAGARHQLDELLAVLRPHVEWEEAGLFARVTAQGEFIEHVRRLEGEHTDLYEQLAAAAGDPRNWADAVRALLDDLDRHIYNENFGLFPGAIAVLDADDWDAIDAARPGIGTKDSRGLIARRRSSRGVMSHDRN